MKFTFHYSCFSIFICYHIYFVRNTHSLQDFTNFRFITRIGKYGSNKIFEREACWTKFVNGFFQFVSRCKVAFLLFKQSKALLYISLVEIPWYSSSLTLSNIWFIRSTSAPECFKEALRFSIENFTFSPEDFMTSICVSIN